MRTKEILIANIIFFSFTGCDSRDMPQSIPEFSMVLTDTTKVFHSKDLPYGMPTMIIWFDPNCRDCQEETEHILASMEKFKQVNILMVTKHPYDELMVFYDHLRLDTCSNIKVGIDKTAMIPKAIKIRTTPLTLVYDRDKLLTGVFRGKAETSALIKIINKKQKG